ncbi:hypothetical protein BLOT_008035 [Blomia tropicalis]|nr:hypothetical protein BLOT_008035 [Blomia tropicalis]
MQPSRNGTGPGASSTQATMKDNSTRMRHQKPSSRRSSASKRREALRSDANFTPKQNSVPSINNQSEQAINFDEPNEQPCCACTII